jgi:hypothetical protein
LCGGILTIELTVCCVLWTIDCDCGCAYVCVNVRVA